MTCGDWTFSTIFKRVLTDRIRGVIDTTSLPSTIDRYLWIALKIDRNLARILIFKVYVMLFEMQARKYINPVSSRTGESLLIKIELTAEMISSAGVIKSYQGSSVIFFALEK